MVQEIKGIVSGISYEKALPRFIAAGILTIIFHMFFLLFTTKPTIKNDHGKKRKYVSLLPINTSLLSEQKLLQWMNIMNPTYAVCPDKKHGFSIDIPKTIPEDLPLEIKKHFLQVQRGKFLPLRVPEQSQVEKGMKLWPYTPAPLFKTIPLLPDSYYPAIIPEKSNLPVIHFSKEEGEMIESIKTKIKATKLGSTILRISFPEKAVDKAQSNTEFKSAYKSEITYFPRIQIIKSCGNSDLDRLAVKKVSLTLSESIHDGDSLLITARWK
jgi:hypothetical protein